MKKFVRKEKSIPKHPHYSSAQPMNGVPIVPAFPSSRPEWRGIGYQKPKKRAPPKVVSKAEREKELEIESSIALDLQQKLFDVVRNTFPLCTRDYEELRPMLAAVKTNLDAGDAQFKAFEESEMREVFLVRWGAERALVLSALLAGWADGAYKEEVIFESLRSKDYPLNVVSFGTGPAEIMALSALVRQVRPDSLGEIPVSEANGQRARKPLVAIRLVQGSANWAVEMDKILTALLALPVLSKYASAAAKAAARPYLMPDSLAFHYHTQNILEEDLKTQALAIGAGKSPCLITLCFSLRDMQVASVAKTLKFMLALTKEAPRGSLLVVVDEPEGDEAVGASDGPRRYPLRFLLDLALLGKDGKEETDAEDEEGKPEPAWERLVGDEERIFKVDSGLKYPLSLAKVRVQVHLFKRT